MSEKRRTQVDFMARYGQVYEHSPWIAREVYARKGGDFMSLLALDQAFREVISGASSQQKMALLRAHPELACAEREGLTEASRAEQSGAGLDRCSPAELAEFERLNKAYRERFGFPFIIAVAGLDRATILERFRARLDRGPIDERREALEQVCRIGRIRLEEAWRGTA